MKLDNLAQRHAAEVRAAFEGASIPPVEDLDTRPRARRRLVAALAGATLFVVAILSASVLGGTDKSTPTTLPSVAGTTTTSVTEPTVADLEVAVSQAIARLTSSPGIEGVQRGFIREYLASSIRFASNLNDAAYVLQQLDRDVLDTGWWLAEDADPPAVNERLTLTVLVSVGDSLYEASLDNPAAGWVVMEGSPLLGGPALALGLLELDDPFRLGAVDSSARVARLQLVDGGSAWTLTTRVGDGELQQRWEIRSTGVLTWSTHAIDATIPIDPTNPFTSAAIEWRPLEATPTISVPGDSVPDYLESLDLPDDRISGEQSSPIVTLPPTTIP